MSKISPPHLWEPQYFRYLALRKSDEAAFHAVSRKFHELRDDPGIFNHEVMQMALDAVVGAEAYPFSLSIQADEYDETLKAQEIFDSL